MKKTIIIAIVLLVITGAAIWILGNKNNPSPAAENTNQSQQTIKATFACDGGKTIQAEFFKGEQAEVQPGQPPVSTGKVKIVLSDGRSMELPQTISADGGRYANSDESFVFWNKGDGALILENGSEKDFKNCTAQQ